MADTPRYNNIYLVLAKNELGEYDEDVGVMSYSDMAKYAYLNKCAVKGIPLIKSARVSK